MSALLFLASDKPFKEQTNPHEKIISINEALALGAEIPDYALELDLDRDKPILLYMDRKIHLNKETKELEDGDFDDDFSIRPFPPSEVYGIHTEKPFCAEVCLHRYTDGRAKNILKYIKEHMQNVEELELWYIWLDDYETPVFRRKELLLSNLSVSTLKELEEAQLTVKPLTHYCYKVKQK